jgi:ribosomal-protein-alanine N-acetyltransferase
MKPIQTERLLLRPFTLDDAVDLHREIYSDFEVVRYYSSKGVLTLQQTRQHLADHLAAWSEGELGRHAVILREGEQFLGQVYLNFYVNTFNRWAAEPNPPFNPLEVELAFGFGRRFWGLHYAHEACRAMIRYAFDELKLRRLVGGAMAENLRSVNFQRRLGYRVEPNLAEPGFVTILDNDRVGLPSP